MSGLFNMLFGEGSDCADILLTALKLNKDEIARYRGCWLEGDKICVHTRTGGGNRDDYEEYNEKLQANEYYISDEDDDFDCTYANFYFNIPEELKQEASKLPQGTPASERWQALFAAMDNSKG
jgi:hypothetical protein